jgi:lysozyme family protein
MSDYDKAFSIVVGEEGGYVNNPSDPGGETNWGITWPTLKQAISLKIVPADTTIKSLTADQAKLIYKSLYWDEVKGDQIAYPLDVCVFDSAVNQGIQPAIKMMQRALDTAQDGVLGVGTLALAAKARVWHAARFMAYRDMRYHSTKNFDKFGEGWLIRIFQVAFKTVLDK